MKIKTLSAIFFLMLFFISCENEGGLSSPTVVSNSVVHPYVKSVKTRLLKKLPNGGYEYLWVIDFSEPMDRESVENSLHIFKGVNSLVHGVNVIQSDMEVLTPSADKRYSWSADNTVVNVLTDLDKNSFYFLYIASTATNKSGVGLDGHVGVDPDGDGKQDIFPFKLNELVTADNDYLAASSDFWSQPLLTGSLKDAQSFYYFLPVTSSFYLEKVKELEKVEDTATGRNIYKYMGNEISSNDTAFSFNWPVKVDSLLEFDFTSDREFSMRDEYWLKAPPLLIDPETLSYIRVYDQNYNFLSDVKFYYNKDPQKLIAVPLEGSVVSFPAINPATVNPDLDYYVKVDFGKNIPSHALEGTYLVIEKENIKYILPVTDNVGSKIKFPVLYRIDQGKMINSKKYYLPFDSFVSGEINGMLVYSYFHHKDNEVFRVQSNNAQTFIVNRVSGNGNNVMDCSEVNYPNEYCNIYLFFDGAKLNLSGAKAFITSDKFYLSISSMEKSTRYFVELGLGSFEQSIKDIWGISFSDRNYDGSYKNEPEVADNTITFSFPTRGGTVLSHPPSLIINDGSIYPYAVSGDFCNDGICFDPQSKIDFSTQCDGKSISVRGYSSIHFSFYTPDGDSGSVYGYNDFLVEETVNDDTVKVLGNDRQKIGIVTTKEVVGKYDPSAPGKGGFPTTLVTFSLLPYLKKCGNSYIKVPVVFEKGDLLILSHKIEALTSNPNRKLDGNKDGILEYSAVDDLKLVFDGSKFVEQK